MSRSPETREGVTLPPHAYVPGQNARHPEGLFDVIKASVTADIPPRLLNETAAWRAGRAYLDSGYFWECHEVLEAVWMQTPKGSPEREMTQALIQLANARLKLRMGKPRATARLCGMVQQHLRACEGEGQILGVDVQEIALAVQEVLNKCGSFRMVNYNAKNISIRTSKVK